MFWIILILTALVIWCVTSPARAKVFFVSMIASFFVTKIIDSNDKKKG